MIDRISLNGCRYIVDESGSSIEDFCHRNKIPLAWIRYKWGKYYLRLWGRYKLRAV